MLKFTALDRRPPRKRDAAERRRDFDEIYAAFAPADAGAQASRCGQCGVPFCQYACPLTNNIPDWLRLAAEGRLEAAYRLSAATNPMPEICGRICPQDRLCEGSCVVEQSGHGTVTIGAIEQHLTEAAWANGWVRPVAVGAPLGGSVGVIGAGPAGLAAAEELRRQGVDVVIYDRHDRAGGLLVYGIPNFKLDKSVVARRIRRLEEAGVRFRLNFEVGRDATLDDIRRSHDAVLIATGVYAPRALGAQGENTEGVIEAIDYLTAANRQGFGASRPSDAHMNASGRRVVVLGGGDTAMDCVRTAVRQGATSVTCLYRRDRAAMPGSAREVTHAEEEGVAFRWRLAPVSIRAELGRAVGVAAAPTAGAAATPAPDGAQEFLEADLIIKALGFEAENLPALFGAPALATSPRGTLATPGAASLETSLPGVYAAGDIVRGASLVVWAIKDGRDAGAEIAAALRKRARLAAE